MVLGSHPDGPEWRLRDAWRASLLEAEVRYKNNRNAETKAEYLRILETFKDLIMNGIMPGETETSDPRVCASDFPAQFTTCGSGMDAIINSK